MVPRLRWNQIRKMHEDVLVSEQILRIIVFQSMIYWFVACVKVMNVCVSRCNAYIRAIIENVRKKKGFTCNLAIDLNYPLGKSHWLFEGNIYIKVFYYDSTIKNLYVASIKSNM